MFCINLVLVVVLSIRGQSRPKDKALDAKCKCCDFKPTLGMVVSKLRQIRLPHLPVSFGGVTETPFGPFSMGSMPR